MVTAARAQDRGREPLLLALSGASAAVALVVIASSLFLAVAPVPGARGPLQYAPGSGVVALRLVLLAAGLLVLPLVAVGQTFVAFAARRATPRVRVAALVAAGATFLALATALGTLHLWAPAA